MILPQAAPGEGAKRDREHFSHWSIGGGEKHTAYVAGKAQWFCAHPSDRGTKPCLHWMTQGELPCRYCALHKVPAEIGYVPVWRQVDWRPLLVIVYDTEREWIEKLLLHDRVTIGRETELGARLWVRRCLDQEPRFNTTMAHRMVAQDITRSLLVLWKLPELTAWLTARKSSDNAVSPDTEQPPAERVPDRVKDVKPAVRAYTPPDPDVAEGAFDAVFNRIKDKMGSSPAAPSANGKHKPARKDGGE